MIGDKYLICKKTIKESLYKAKCKIYIGSLGIKVFICLKDRKKILKQK